MSLPEVEKLFNEHFHCAVYMAQSIVSSKEIAEDIVQNVFVKLLDDRHSNVKYPVSFLYICVRNAALDYSRSQVYSLRAMNRFQRLREEGPSDEEFNFLPAEEAEHLMHVQQLFKAMEQLPPRTREVVRQVYFNDRSYQETADLLGVSLATIKSHMYQSFKMLRERLAGFYPGRARKKKIGY